MRKSLFSTQYTRHISSIFKTLDDHLVCIGWYDGCDYTDTSQRSFISKFNTSGNQQFYTAFKSRFQNVTYSNDSPKTGLQHPDSSYYVFTDSVMFHFSKSGLFLSKSIGLGVDEISSALLLADSNILLSAKIGNNNSLVKIAPSGSILAQAASPALFTRMSFYDNQNIIGRANALYKISPSLSVIGASSLPAGESIFNFDVANDTIYSVGSNSVTPVYRIMDTSFNSIATSTTSTQRISQSAITARNGLVAILSGANSASAFSANNTFSGLNVFPKFQSNNFVKDAQVLRIEADSMHAIISGGPGSWTYYIRLRANVWVKNNGTAVINSVKLNSYLQSFNLCWNGYYQKLFSGLNLQPGDSVALNTGWINKNLHGGYGYSPVVPYCIYSTLPDSANDKDISNDGICRSFTFQAVGVRENSMVDQHLDLFPNPAAENIAIQSGAELRSVLFYDISGRLVKTVVKPGNQKPIPISDLNPGLYLLRIETESGTVQRKFIKD